MTDITEISQLPVVTLKTHTVYPDIFIDDDGNYVGKLIAVDGTVKEMWEGAVDKPKNLDFESRKAMRKAATFAVWKGILNVIDKYKKPAEMQTAKPTPVKQ